MKRISKLENNNGGDFGRKDISSTQTNPATPPGEFLARFLKQFWYFVIIGSFVALVDMFKDIFTKPPTIPFEQLEKRTNQVAVITGGTRGIGFNIVKKLLQLDYTVLLGVRNKEAGENGIQEIRKMGVASGKVKLFYLDLKSLHSVHQFANQVLTSNEGKRIDLLLNNAGIMNAPYEKTEDNFESHFQVNFLSHFLLTNLLMARIKETAARKNDPCQIVNTSSHAQRGGRIDFDELEESKVYSPAKCYFDSKLCQVIHARTLENRFQEEGLNIHAYSVHPGEIPTDLWLHLGLLVRLFRPLVQHICRSSDEAANVVLYPVLTPEIAETQGGQYFESGTVKIPNQQAFDRKIQQRLWDKSLELTSKSKAGR